MNPIFSMLGNKLGAQAVNGVVSTGVSSIFGGFKIYFIIAFIAVLGGLGAAGYGIYTSLGTMRDTIATLKADNKKLADTVAEQQSTIQTLKDSTTVTVATVSDNLNSHAAAEKKKDTVKSKKDTKVEGIKDDFSKLPQTPENQAKEESQISTVNIDALWEIYCDAKDLSKGNAECVNVPGTQPATEPVKPSNPETTPLNQPKALT